MNLSKKFSYKKRKEKKYYHIAIRRVKHLIREIITTNIIAAALLITKKDWIDRIIRKI